MLSELRSSTAGAVYCQTEAYEMFCEQLPVLHTTAGLRRAAIAVALHAFDDVDVRRVEQRLEVLSLRVLERSPSRRPAAILANLHAVLFEEEGFVGDLQGYYNALNSYLPAVLNSRRGIPILLSLVYKLVAEGTGLVVEGLNAPGHFMVRVACDRRWMIVDPFYGGQVLSREEAFCRMERVLERKLPRRGEYLAAATHHQWLTRILGNLRQLFTNEGRLDDLAAMNELAAALEANASAAGSIRAD
jgi:regulator of sirC expression with transglutaminase-like and TPR domain